MEQFFKEVGRIVQKSRIAQNESVKRGEQFNMFAAMGVNHYETKHSAFIAELLNPEGSHGQGTIFLSSFLNVCCQLDFDFSLIDIKVYTEFATDGGRIDILITNKDKQGLVIENKIYALDGEEQLKRYNEEAKRLFPNGYRVIYLSLNGDEASEQSSKGIDYQTISYRTDIVRWLEECVRECVRLPLIRETLIQYINHIKQLTNQSMEREEQRKLFEAMESHAEETEAILNAANNGYSRFIWNKYVKPAFENYAVKNGLLYVDGDTYQYFHRPEWEKTAVAICMQGKRHYIGVSCTSDSSLEYLAQLPKQRLTCLPDEPTDWWPYGTEWLVPYERWDAGNGTIPAMIDGRFAKFVTDKVKRIIDEVEEKNLLMF